MRAEKALITRRHVIYVGGYDPQGAEGYYRLFERSWKRFLMIWPLTTKLGPLERDAQDFAHWDVEAAGPNWRVATRYEFLRQEHMIRANMAEPMTRQIPRALAWALDYLVSGALLRLWRGACSGLAGAAGARHRYRVHGCDLRFAAPARGSLVRGADQ